MNPAVLERQLMQIALAKGVNERDRPETADPTSTLSRMENLIQDQGGAFIKRPGDTILASTDLDGGALAIQRLIRTTDGLVGINQSSFLMQYVEGYGGFKKRSQGPQLSMFGADLVASSGPNVSAVVQSAASSSKYHAVAASSGQNSSGDQLITITVFDKAAGAVAVTYDAMTITGATAGSGGGQVRMVWVADRYLMVFCLNRVTTVDMGGATAPTSAALTALSSSFALSSDIGGAYDIAADGTRAFAVNARLGAYTVTAVTASTGVVNETVSMPEYCLICVSGTDLWYVGPTFIGAKSAANLATQTVTQWSHTLTGQPVGFVASTSVKPTIVMSSALSLGSSTTTRLSFYAALTNGAVPTASGGVDGWVAVSNPFIVGSDGDVFVHLNKNTGQDLSQHCIVSIRPGTAQAFINNGNLGLLVRAEVTLEPFNGVYVAPTIGLYRPSVVGPSASRAHPVVAVRTTSRGCGFAVFDVRANSHSKRNAVTFGGNTYVSGGGHSMYDGSSLSETQFIDSPLMNAANSATAGVVAAGAYKYLAVYRCTDANSSGSFSRCSPISSVTAPGAKKVDVSVLPCGVTRRTTDIVVDLYRTLSGGTQYYLCASSQFGTPMSGLLTQSLLLQSTRIFTVSDNLTDAQLALQPTLYRQPGTPNSALDRYPPPGGHLLCQHRDRLFTTDPYGTRVYYSSFFVDGECAWFNPALSFMVHGGTGPITAIASMDGRLFVFKKDAVFVVDGDGPSEAGPAGNEYSPPQRLATEYGCADARGLVVTTEGIVYRSQRGVELLTRSLQLKWVGDRVQNTSAAYPFTVGSLLDTFGRVHILVASTDPVVGPVSAQNGRELVWDIPSDAWTIHLHTPSDGTYGHAMQDICLTDISSLGQVITYADPVAGVVYANTANGTDRTAYVPWAVESVWIRNGQQTRQRIEDILFLAKKRANHAIRISVAYDYVDGYTQVAVWQPDTLNLMNIEELNLQVLKPQCTALRVLIEEIQQSDTVTYPIGTGRGAEILGITANVAAQAGIPLLASYQKCTTGTASASGAITAPAPSVLSVSPSSGVDTGGTSITIAGANFVNGATAKIGGVACTSVVWVNSAQLTAVTPAGADGSQTVAVTNPDAQVGTLPSGFTYTSAAPTLSSLSLSQGDTGGGGQSIVATGTNCSGVTSVLILGNSVSPSATSSTTVTFTLPAHAAGTGTVALVSPGGTSGTLPFEYWTPAQITGIDAYLDANKGVALGTGSLLSTWTDQSSNARVFTAPSGKEPSVASSVFGSLPSMRFVPSQFAALGAKVGLSGGFSAFAVGKWTATTTVPAADAGNSPLTVIGDTVAAWDSFGASAGGINVVHYGTSGGANAVVRGSGMNDGNPHLFGVTLDTTCNVKAYAGDVQQGSTATDALGLNAATGYSSVGSGWPSSGAAGWDGDLGAVVVVSGVISGSDLTKLNLWSKQRFGTP